MKIEMDELIFSTGKTRYANCGIIGLSPKGSISEGYDGGLWDKDMSNRDLYDEDEDLTKAERVELAEYMIRQWGKFLDDV